MLRFPITVYPVNGKDIGSGFESNQTSRSGTTGTVQRQYEHKGTHIVNIPLGSFHLDEEVIECIVTPRDQLSRIASEPTGSDRTCRTKLIQVILEYK